MNFDKFLESISKIENIDLPGEESQFKMSPPFRKKLLERYKEKMKEAQHAGVMALFYPDVNKETRFVLILRKTYKGVHSAQIGFPGGKVEPQDKGLKDTALRETFEEVGVPVEDMEVLKQLSDVYIPPSNFYVQPYIGICRKTPRFVRQQDEVEAVVRVLLADLLDDSNVVKKKVPTSLGVDVTVPAIKLNKHLVWGATAMMLSEVKDLLKEVL